MPIDFRGMNSDYIKYFNLEEYVDRIKLQTSVLKHLESTNSDFDEYMNELSKYDENYIINYWIDSMYQELAYNQIIENTKFDMGSLANRSVFFDTLNITHKRIHNLHNFVIEKDIEQGFLEPTTDYRKVPVNVSRFLDDGTEEIFWRGVNPEDVKKFMDDFIKVYKQGGTKLLFSNPFLASALMHLLFIRIHPYTDGNGRTARVIHNIKFTEMINKLYGTRLKLSPLNLSGSILLNKITYVKRLDNIYFDVEHDTNDNINKWFDFILDMADERIFVARNKLDTIDMAHIKTEYKYPQIKSDMRLSKIKQKK